MPISTPHIIKIGNPSEWVECVQHSMTKKCGRQYSMSSKWATMVSHGCQNVFLSFNTVLKNMFSFENEEMYFGYYDSNFLFHLQNFDFFSQITLISVVFQFKNLISLQNLISIVKLDFDCKTWCQNNSLILSKVMQMRGQCENLVCLARCNWGGVLARFLQELCTTWEVVTCMRVRKGSANRVPAAAGSRN